MQQAHTPRVHNHVTHSRVCSRTYTHTTHVGSSTGPGPQSPHRCLRTLWGPTPPQSLSRRVSPSPSSSPDWSTWSIQVPGDGSGGRVIKSWLGRGHESTGPSSHSSPPLFLGPDLLLPQEGTVRGGKGPCQSKGDTEGRGGTGVPPGGGTVRESTAHEQRAHGTQSGGPRCIRPTGPRGSQ